MVTSAPRRRNACPSSRPIGPPPMTARRAGKRGRVKMVRLVWGSASARPGMGGRPGPVPVAMTTLVAPEGPAINLDLRGRA